MRQIEQSEAVNSNFHCLLRVFEHVHIMYAHAYWLTASDEDFS